MSSRNDKPARKIWTREEKKRLLEIIKIEGHTNYEKIAQFFPDKSPLAIKSKINKYVVLSKSMKPGVVDPLDYWLHSHFHSEGDSLISKALLFIRLFEDHPPFDEASGIQFETIYGFLHRLTLGHPPNEISEQSFKAFETEIKKVIEYVTSKSEKEVLTHLSTLSSRLRPTKDYTRKKA